MTETSTHVHPQQHTGGKKMRADTLIVHVDDPGAPAGHTDVRFNDVDYYPNQAGLQIFPADSGPISYRPDEIVGFEAFKLAAA